MRKALKKNLGFSLVELLIFLLLSLVVLGAVFLLAHDFQKSYSVEQEVASMEQNLRLTLDLLAREIRGAGNNPNSANVTTIVMDPNGNGIADDLRIQKDANPPDEGTGGNLSDAYEDLTFAHNPTQKVITVRDNVLGGQAQALSDDNISSLRFAYLRANGRGATTVAAEVGVIRITLEGQTKVKDPKTNNFINRTLVSDVRLRSR